MPGHAGEAAEVLRFWFAETPPRQWFARDPTFDALLRERFLGLTRRAFAGDERALPLFERFTDARTADFARRHRDVIARFGRFPHRNAALGRESTPQELVFLQTPGSGF